MENKGLKETLVAFKTEKADSTDMLRALEREFLYVPIERLKVGKVTVDLPVYTKLSDGSQCITVFSSDTVIDSAFYQKHTWKRMGYLELETFVLRQAERNDVIIDPYSDNPFVLRTDIMEKISEIRTDERKTDEDATLDTEIGGFEEAVRKMKILFPVHKEICRVFALTYRAGDEKALCLVVETKEKSSEKEDVFHALFSDIYHLLGPQIPIMLLSYADVWNEIRQLKAEPCYVLS